MSILIKPLEWVMNGCYTLCNNYGWAIVLFTLISNCIDSGICVGAEKFHQNGKDAAGD